jgi:hypothetical protein
MDENRKGEQSDISIEFENVWMNRLLVEIFIIATNTF